MRNSAHGEGGFFLCSTSKDMVTSGRFLREHKFWTSIADILSDCPVWNMTYPNLPGLPRTRAGGPKSLFSKNSPRPLLGRNRPDDEGSSTRRGQR
jgi:hypothetical protein